MKFAIAIFLLIASAVILSAHLALYLAISRFFNISDEISRKITLLILILLSFSFLSASLLIHYHEGAFSKYFYWGASFWTGLALYLLLASAVAWIIIGLAETSGLKPDTKIITGILYIVALAVALYGVHNARHPNLTEIEINIPNLPPEWQSKRVVQVSDLHLGAIMGQGYLERLIARINDIDPAAVFITGDYFDGTYSELEHFSAPLDRINTDNIFFVPGNHETYIGIDKVANALSQTKVKLLRNQIVDLNGLAIVGLDYPRYRENINYTLVFEQIESDKPTILLFHEPRLLNLAKQYKVNLQLAGHTHAGQIFPINIITRMIFKKYYYGLHREGDYSIYTTSGTGTWGPPMRVGNHSEIVVFTLN